MHEKWHLRWPPRKKGASPMLMPEGITRGAGINRLPVEHRRESDDAADDGVEPHHFQEVLLRKA